MDSENRSIRSHILGLTLLAAPILFLSCRQDMHDQPKYKPFRPSTFFDNGESQRPLVDGTVPRRDVRNDPYQDSGESNGGRTLNREIGAIEYQPAGEAPLYAQQKAAPQLNLQAAGSDQSRQISFPLPITKELLDRGEGRFNISCSPCHGRLGDGEGMVVQRGFRQPPSYHIDRLRRAPVGHFYDVISNGFGAMPSYADQVAPRDRWAIIAYIRALQLSQHATLADVPPAERDKIGAGGRSR